MFEKKTFIYGVQDTKSEASALSQDGTLARDFAFKASSERQDTESHQCALGGERRDITTIYIDGGLFVSLRRKIRRFLMISHKHPYTRQFASSLHRINLEEDRHLIFHYHLIHPLSMFSFYCDVILFCGVLTNMIAAPIVIMIYSDQREELFNMSYPATVLYSLLIVNNLITGHYDIKKNKVVLNMKNRCICYLKTYFMFDVLSLLPQVLRSTAAAKAGIDYNVRSDNIVKFVAPTLTMCIYFRYFWCLRILGELRLYLGTSTYAYKTIILLLNTIMIILISVYILFTIMRHYPGYWEDNFLKHVEHTISMLFLVGYSHPAVNRGEGMFLPIIFILIGFLLHLLMLVKGMEIWYKFSSVENRQTAIYNSTNAYMRYRALPVDLRKKIYLYLDFKYQGFFYKESVIRNATSPALRREIHLTITRESIQRVELFEKCSALVMNKIRANLVSEIFLPGDVIIKSGTTGHCMFFILAGTVMVTNPDDKRLCYLRDGAHFGEIALVVNVARVANVVAVTPCELYKLDRHHFWTIMKYHPEIWREIQVMATDRIVKTSNSSFSRLHYATLDEKSFEIIGDKSATIYVSKLK